MAPILDSYLSLAIERWRRRSIPNLSLSSSDHSPSFSNEFHLRHSKDGANFNIFIPRPSFSRYSFPRHTRTQFPQNLYEARDTQLRHPINSISIASLFLLFFIPSLFHSFFFLHSKINYPSMEKTIFWFIAVVCIRHGKVSGTLDGWPSSQHKEKSFLRTSPTDVKVSTHKKKKEKRRRKKEKTKYYSPISREKRFKRV